MTKINFNMASFKNSVLPNLNNVIDTLNSIIDDTSNSYVPRDFVYYNKLKEFQTSNIDSRNILVNIQDNIYISNKNFDNSLDEISNELRRIDNVKIGRRESSIK